MRTISIACLSAFGLLILSSLCTAQERKVVITRYENGKQVVEEYSGAKLDAYLKQNETHSSAQVVTAPAQQSSTVTSGDQRVMTIDRGDGSKPVVYKGSEIDAYYKQSATTQATVAPTPKPDVMSVMHPDGTITTTKNTTNVVTGKINTIAK